MSGTDAFPERPRRGAQSRHCNVQHLGREGIFHDSLLVNGMAVSEFQLKIFALNPNLTCVALMLTVLVHSVELSVR